MPGSGVAQPRQQPIILNKAKIFAILVDEPFRVPIKEIWDLTDYQIFTIYLWPRGKEGEKIDQDMDVKLRSVINIYELKHQFYVMGSQLKQTQAQLDASWRSAWPGWDV